MKPKLLILPLTVMLLTGLTTPVPAAISQQREQAILEGATSQNNNTNFYDRRSEGWYWYEDEEAERKKKLEEYKKKQAQIAIQMQPKEQPENPIKVPIVDAKTGELQPTIVIQAQTPTVKPLSAEWLKQKMPEMLQAAIDRPFEADGSPSKEAKAYMYMQRLTLDKAQNFSKAATTITQLDPFLDENSRVPIDSAANRAFLQNNDKNEEIIVKRLAQKVGLWFIFDSSCSFCLAQYAYLKDFKIMNNFTTMNISMDGTRLSNMDANEVIYPDQGQAKTLKIRITPTIVMLHPPNNYYIVSQGLMSPAALLSRILLVADQNNLLTKQERDLLDPYQKGVLTPEQIEKMQKVQGDLDKDPTKIVDMINKAVGY